MDSEGYNSDWWLWMTYLSIIILIIIGICKLTLEFPGLLDLKFIKQKWEDVEDPDGPLTHRESFYRPVMRLSREVVWKISSRRNWIGSERVRKKGVCVMVDLHQPVMASDRDSELNQEGKPHCGLGNKCAIANSQ